MKYEVDMASVNGREVPNTFHDAVKMISNAVRKGTLHPSVEARLMQDTNYDTNTPIYSVYGLFLNEAERNRVDFHDTLSFYSESQSIRKMLGINKLEQDTIYGMTAKDLKKITAKHAELVDEYVTHYSDGISHKKQERKAAKRFKKSFKAYLKELLLLDNYDNLAFDQY
jgi:hypothetical protein